MKQTQLKQARQRVRSHLHQWKPIHWAYYDNDEPDTPVDDPDYALEKAMLVSELDGVIDSIVRQLPRVKTELDLGHLLYRALRELDVRLALDSCLSQGKILYRKLDDAQLIQAS